MATRAEKRPTSTAADVELAYNNEWWDRGSPLKRTSLIIDPADGRLPALTEEGKEDRGGHGKPQRQARGPADSWTDRPLQERCLVYHGVPPFPTGYNNNYQIVQNQKFVAIRYEMMAETRIIPLDGRPQLTAQFRSGSAARAGHWEGDTLVVETTDYSDQTHVPLPGGERQLARRRAVHARRARTRSTTGSRCDNPVMYTTPLDGRAAVGASEGPLFQVRLPRRQLRHARRAERASAEEKEEAAKKGSN